MNHTHVKKQNSDEDDVAIEHIARVLDAKSPHTFVTALKRLRYRHLAIVVILLAALAASMVGLRSDAGKAVAMRVIASLRRRTTGIRHATEDLWARVFRRVNKRKLEQAAKLTGPAKLARAFRSLWPMIINSASFGTALGLMTATNPAFKIPLMAASYVVLPALQIYTT
jgi:hypothetical protein